MMSEETPAEGAEASGLGECYNQHIRPLLDAVDKLRNLDVMREGIQLPSIVVVGDQSSGKSSVLESLAGISLPRGQGICTRVPLVMRLQNCSQDEAVTVTIEYDSKKEVISESDITAALNRATNEIAGDGKGISDKPITLHVRKPNAPDLTMVDLPGITRVPVSGQPEDIYEQISQIIMRYMTPKESIILNVLSASVDFPTCESIRMSQRVDEHGERTLAVVTKVDKSPEGLLEKVTVDAVSIGLGYVCVRNRIGDESIEEARKKEAELFRWHPLLSKIDKSMVGIPVLAKRLTRIQANSISRFLPDIVKKVDTTLAKRESELRALPHHSSNPGEAMFVFINLMNAIKECLNKILIQGDFEQFPEEPRMHCTARLKEMFDSYYTDLCQSARVCVGTEFLGSEIKMLEEAKGVGLPNFLPRCVFLNLLQHLVNKVWERSLSLVSQVWDYLESVILRVIDLHCQSYPQLHTVTRRVVQSLISSKRTECVERVKQMLEMESSIDFTLNPVYTEIYSNLLKQRDQFMLALRKLAEEMEEQNNECACTSRGNPSASTSGKIVVIQGLGGIRVEEMLKIPVDELEKVFNMGMSVVAYWKVVIVRLGDSIPLHLQFVARRLVTKNEVTEEIVREVAARRELNAMEKMVEESAMVATRRKSLRSSVDLLRDSKAALSNIADRISAA